MDHKAEARRIYEESMAIERDKGQRNWFRKRALEQLEPKDRWLVKQYINNISVKNKPKNHHWNMK